MVNMRGAYTVWGGELTERNHIKEVGVDEDNIKIDLHELGCGVWNR
jgi:hypothetical protein